MGESGERIDVDIIVSATGLELHSNPPMANVEVSVDGKPYNAPNHHMYKSCMLSDVPNFLYCRGYFQASWTLKTDITSKFLCRLLFHMQKHGFDMVVPRLPDNGVEPARASQVKSGYVQRKLHRFPKSGLKPPWMNVESFDKDDKLMLQDPLEDEFLRFVPRKDL